MKIVGTFDTKVAFIFVNKKGWDIKIRNFKVKAVLDIKMDKKCLGYLEFRSTQSEDS